MASRNRHLHLEQPFEELPQRRPRRPPAEHNVLKARDGIDPSNAPFAQPVLADTSTVGEGAHSPASLPTGDLRPWRMDTTARTPDEAPWMASTSTSIRVLNISRDGEPSLAAASSHGSAILEESVTPHYRDAVLPGQYQAPPPPRHGRRSAAPPTSSESSSRGAKLHLDFDHPTPHRYPRDAPHPSSQGSAGIRPPSSDCGGEQLADSDVFNTPSHRAVATAPVGDPHEAAVAALRLREHPARTVSRGGATATGSRRSSSKPGLPPRHLPPHHEKLWLQGLDQIVTSVWATLGFLALPPLSASPSPVRAATVPLITIEDQALFIAQLRFYFAAGGKGLERVACTRGSLANALWYVVFNAVYYCVNVLGSAYASVENSVENSVDHATAPFRSEAATLTPTPLLWRGVQNTAAEVSHHCDGNGVPTSIGERLRELARQFRPPPPEARRRSESGAPQRQTDTETSALSEGGMSSVWGAEGEEVDPAQYTNAFSEAPLFGIEDWLFAMRCMASIGYQRDAFYLQAPSSACPQELVLALLWLTKTYQLLAVAEYVELNVRFPFLLVQHTDPCELGGSTIASDSIREKAGRRLLAAFPQSGMWPPASFDEDQAIDRRLHGLQRLLGGSSDNVAHAAKDGASALLRRLLAVRRQVDLSLRRIESGLHQRTDQIRFLGLHSPLDAQICLPEFDASYHHLLAGLRYVRGLEERTSERVAHLTAAGDLVAYALRHHRTTGVPTESQVLDDLEEDATTWLEPFRGPHREDTPSCPPDTRTAASRRASALLHAALPPTATSGLNGNRLMTAMSKFRATRVKQYLADLWRSLTRRAQMETAPPTESASLRPRHDARVERPFAADPHAQRSHQGQIRRSLASRYSLQGALAAELLLLQQQQQRPQAGERRDPFPDYTAPLFSLDALPLDLTCSANARFQHLAHERSPSHEGAQEGTAPAAPPLPTTAYQLTEVGAPAASSTTSARLELRRLSDLLAEIESDPEVSTRERSANAAVATLQRVYRLRATRTIAGG